MRTLNGNVFYREKMALPPDAIINVRLLDVSRLDVSAAVLAEQQIQADESRRQVPPIPFALDYDETTVDDRMSYAVRAEIRDGSGKLLWTTDTTHPVLTRGGPTEQVDVRVVGVQR